MSSQKSSIVGIGEVLWDVFPDGKRFGGAPANFACNIASLSGGKFASVMVSAVGNDPLGEEALRSLQSAGVDISHVPQVPSATGKVLVQLDDEGKASYQFAENTAWDNLCWHLSLENISHRAAAVCFGSLGQRSELSRGTIQRFVTATPKSALRIFDINLRPPFVTDSIVRESLEIANVLKLNEDELPYLATMYRLRGGQLEIMRQLASQFELRCVALTSGAEGATLIRGDELSVGEAIPTDVVDTVGAGDAYTASLALGLLNGDRLDTINGRAMRIAAFVCSQAGATPTIPTELMA